MLIKVKFSQKCHRLEPHGQHADIWHGCTSGISSSNPGSQTVPDPIPLSLSHSLPVKSLLSYHIKGKKHHPAPLVVGDRDLHGVQLFLCIEAVNTVVLLAKSSLWALKETKPNPLAVEKWGLRYLGQGELNQSRSNSPATPLSPPLRLQREEHMGQSVFP